MTTTDYVLYMIGVAAVTMALTMIASAAMKDARPARILTKTLIVVGIGLSFGSWSMMSRVDNRIRAIEKTHAEEERISPLVEEIYQNIHDLQDRAGALEIWTGKAPDPEHP